MILLCGARATSNDSSECSTSCDFRLQLAGLLDGDGLGGLAGLGADLLDSLDEIETLLDLAENDVLAIEPRGLDGADEELRAVAVEQLVLGSAVGCLGVRTCRGRRWPWRGYRGRCALGRSSRPRTSRRRSTFRRYL